MTTVLDRAKAAGLAAGSLTDITRKSNSHLAASFVDVDCVILVDSSTSMTERDGRDGDTRFNTACGELTQLQATLPGKLAVVSFSSGVEFCPSGLPVFIGGGTDLTGALNFVKLADVGGIRFIVISDGEPDNPVTALAAAAKFTGRIDGVYVGKPDGPGQKFLFEMAAQSGGRGVQAAQANDLAPTLQRLLTAA